MKGMIVRIAIAAAFVSGGSLAAVGITNGASAPEEDVVAKNGESVADLPDQAQAGKQTAADKRAAARAHAEAVREWTDCVREAASARGDEGADNTGPFDPTDACGDHPSPSAEMTDPPPQANENAGGGGPEVEGEDDGTGRPEGAGPPEDVPPERP